MLLQPVRDLHGQALLHLQVAGEHLDHPGKLGEAEDPLARQVADVGDPWEAEVRAEGGEQRRGGLLRGVRVDPAAAPSGSGSAARALGAELVSGS